MQPWSEIKKVSGKNRLYVHGKPFVSLGIQVDFLHCTKVDDFDMYFDHLEKMHCNTVYFPIRWFVFEPEQGKYDFTVIDHALNRCREKNLFMSLLWFGTNQGGGMYPSPKWLQNNPAIYKRMWDENGTEQGKLCPSCPETLAIEKKALDTLLSHVAETDTDRRVILLQVENEPCVEMGSQKNKKGTIMDPWSFHCHCPVCTKLFEEQKVDEWAFSARSLTRYFSKLLADQKRIYPLVTYVNFLLNPQRPGEDLDIYLNECPEIDIVAVDYYGFCAADLSFTMRFFNRGRNTLFVAEHSTESCGDAAGNVFRAVCEHGAVAFDPWAIDHTFGWRGWRDHVSERPFVARDGSWSDVAIAYGRSLMALNAANELIAANACTDNIMYYAAEHNLPRSLEERRWGMVWRTLAGPTGRWVLIRSSDTDFTLAGVGLQAALEPLDISRKWSVEAGSWKNGEWVKTGDAPIRRQTESAKMIEFEEGLCVRIRLE